MRYRAMPDRVSMLAEALEPMNRFCTQSAWARRQHDPGIADFTFANPQEMPLSAVVDAFHRWSTPLTKDWFAYKTNEDASCDLVAASLRQRTGVPFDPSDVVMTNGAFAALSIGLKAITDPGDEIIMNLPPWVFYEALIREAGLTPVKVSVAPETFDLDLDSIERAITPRTRAIIVNTPNNPTGRIYPQQTLRSLADLLRAATQQHGHPIYIVSDEPYCRIVFNGRQSVSPAEVYPHTLLVYSYSKILLTPGQRVGYLAIPRWMPERESVRSSIQMVQVAAGWAFPNALMQHALADLESTALDLDQLQRKRDVLVSALRKLGYCVNAPEGTFYLMPKSPLSDDEAFADLLAQHDIFVLPGAVFDFPGYFRISLTASEDIIERSLNGFAAAIACARSTQIVPH